MKITVDINESDYIALKMLSDWSKKGIETVLRECIWRETHGYQKMITEYLEKDFKDFS